MARSAGGREQTPRAAAAELRRRALQRASSTGPRNEGSSADRDRLRHELHVHEIELEMQNESLRETQAELVAAHDRLADLYDHAPVGYLTLDAAGTVLEANLTASTILGVQARGLIGERLVHRVTPDSHRAWNVHRRLVIARRTTQTCELGMRRADGGIRIIRLESVAVRTEQHRAAPATWRSALIDITDQVETARALAETRSGLQIESGERRVAERALRMNEARLRAIVEAAVDGIIVLDGQARIESLNPAAERMFGYPGAELVGRSVRVLVAMPGDAGNLVRATRSHAGAANALGAVRELVGRRKDGSVFPLELTLSGVESDPRSIVAIVRDISERQHLHQVIAERLTDEQRNLGRELHDGLAQRITALELMGAALESRLRQRSVPESRDAGALLEQAREAQRELRRVIKGVYPYTVPSGGLESALRELVRELEPRHGVRGELRRSGRSRIADAQVATQLYYVAREAVFNAVRHAEAKRITIHLEQFRHRVAVRVEDDGIGIDMHLPWAGMGMQIMQYRADLIGAVLKLRRTRQHGTVVTCVRHIPTGRAGRR